MADPDSTTRWYQALYPIAERGGAVLTLALLCALVVSTWWWLTSWMRECVGHNRQLNERILAQQERFYADLRMALAHCDKAP